ncbi:hypothetical protein HAQ06_00985 [Pseudomonas sp. C2L12B]|uniref:Uncharacterized protein n=2 Tax=Pseudomonas typographi TaxID=2715964 RepID=A0ABR7YVQ8_9PSED|nr:hypothetical protein [Pseudomonas typographi]MBD1549860.1 hypothetical protein [Pseudomonas typographi]MBD1585241.1 hypothetical protein [Pseudomonas typographi]MBD1597288.1 hypothetical protein [Pseudomonas typographi]
MPAGALPGGDQDVFNCFSPALKACLLKAPRVVLVANNPAITAADLQALGIGSDDVVVSFNKCLKAELLTPHSVNVVVHGFNAPDHYFFGLPLPGAIQPWFHPRSDRCFSILVGCTEALCPLPGVSVFRERIPLPPLWNYPVERPGGKRYVGPSTGFNALVLFDALRSLPGYDYALMALGFSDEAGKLWGGHAWDYERAWLRSANIIRVGLQRQKRWWQLWRRR